MGGGRERREERRETTRAKTVVGEGKVVERGVGEEGFGEDFSTWEGGEKEEGK